MRSKHAGELATLRDEVSRLELRLAEERRERKTVEDQVTQAHSEHHSKARDLEGEGTFYDQYFYILSLLVHSMFNYCYHYHYRCA